LSIEQSTYEILHARLTAQARELRGRTEALNARRLELFGGVELAVIGSERIRTENNCVPRDLVSVGKKLLFGYNVFVGMRTEVAVQDVFSLSHWRVKDQGGEPSFAIDKLADDDPENFLSDPRFVKDFKELYRYYRDTRLFQLRKVDGKLLAIFKTGASVTDVKVFRWALDAGENATYLDNRGERDHVFPPAHDFEWQATTRDNHVQGRHPHVSILDRVFVETIGGDLTIKVENNTESGQGIYREPVVEPNQSLADAQILYAAVGSVVLLRILPYNEKDWRHFVFNSRTKKAERLDQIGRSCVFLPEDHGVVFPGGYHLQNGETRTFEGDVGEMEFLRSWRSPNGEDVLFAFYERVAGHSILLPYNLIRKEAAAPIHCHGMALFEDGLMVLFRAAGEEPTRIHPMQIWRTPFWTEEYAAEAPRSGSFLEKIGNADLVRGISDLLALSRAALASEPSAAGFEDQIATAGRIADAYHWLSSPEVGDLLAPLRELRGTADTIVGEFAKVEAIKADARKAVAEREAAFAALVSRLRAETRHEIDHFVTALAELQQERGRLIAARDLRYVDEGAVAALEAKLVERGDELARETTSFLLGEKALLPYHQRLAELAGRIPSLAKTAEAKALGEELEKVGGGLDLLTEIVGGLTIEDATERTAILERISEVLAIVNRARAELQARRKELMLGESAAEFGARFNLLAQGIAGSLALCDTPERCDEQLSKQLLQLEELEGRFGEVDSFVEQLAQKREDLYEAFTARKQVLVDERQRRAGRLQTAAERLLEGIGRRSASLGSAEELAAYFVSDPMVGKLRELAGQLRGLGSAIKADELDGRLKSLREEAGRSLRDRREIFEDGAAVLRLGQHRFSVNSQPFEATLVPREVGHGPAGGGPAKGNLQLFLQLTGTDFAEPLSDPALDALREHWDQQIVSENAKVYRGEYLAASLLFAAEEEKHGLSLDVLRAKALEGPAALGELTRQVAAERYDEGYERGVHDADAALLLEALVALYTSAGLLRFAPRTRAMALLFWIYGGEPAQKAGLEKRSRSLGRLRKTFGHSREMLRLAAEVGREVEKFCTGLAIEIGPAESKLAGLYLFEELAQGGPFATGADAVALRNGLLRQLENGNQRRELEEELREGNPDRLGDRFHLACAWVAAYIEEHEAELGKKAPSLEEAALLLLSERKLERQASEAPAARVVEGLLGQHGRIDGRKLELRLDEFLTRLISFRDHDAPGFRRYQEVRHRLLAEARERLRLGELQPKVMSSFVRNQLIQEVYLPLVGANLAKQLGSLGEKRRVDQMGLLLLVSPPGYGKTTLMEYVANRLGLIFVKVNGPAIGHAVKSLDPGDAPDATSRQEVQKINFAFEMANNVLLYLDDIQHVDPELLQKFISLCDAQRKIEGVWNGRARTYDLKGKRFAICMAGNPYTESGARFKIPDMLANRADTYNLGDILQGKDEAFALSFLENALTSNPVLARLAGRDPQDVLLLAAMARGESIQSDQLKHPYSGNELEEILAVLRRLIKLRQVVLAVNREYIASAAQDDKYRTEPKFQLQGSYRNMNKMAEKVAAVMNDQELESLIDDHYRGEAQTLTTGAESNLLKLAKIRGRQSEEQKQRWEEIKKGFQRIQVMGSSEEDPAVRVLGQLGLMGETLQAIDQTLGAAARKPPVVIEAPAKGFDFEPIAARLEQGLTELAQGLALALEQRNEKAPSPVQVAAPVAPPAPPPVLAPVIDLVGVAEVLQPYLERLDHTLRSFATAGAQANGGPPAFGPAMLSLIEKLGKTVEDEMLPLVQGMGRQLKAAGVDDRRMVDRVDRSLKSLDLFRDLLAALRKS
jgi:hypothetical protein